MLDRRTRSDTDRPGGSSPACSVTANRREDNGEIRAA
jgi:hypothetical protein